MRDRQKMIGTHVCRPTLDKGFWALMAEVKPVD